MSEGHEKNLYKNYTNLDIVHTILDLLGDSVGAPSGASDSPHDSSLLLYFQKLTFIPSWIDGCSMLHPPKSRLTLSFSNPNTGIVLCLWPHF